MAISLLSACSYDYFEKPVNFNPNTRHIGRDSSVGIATQYGLVGSGMESQWGS